MNEPASKATRRNGLWYVKWLFASYACGFGLALLVCTIALPLVGPNLFLLITKPAGAAAMFVLMALSAPVLYRYLK